MKKITFFFAGLLMTLSVLASSELTLNPFYAWGDGLKVKDNVVTTDADKAWSGAQIWLGRDMSAYDYIWLEISECSGAFAVSVNYSEGADSYVEINAGSDQLIAIALDPTRKTNVNKIELKNRDAVAAGMTIQGVYAGTAAQLNAAWDDFRTALDFQYFSAWYGATFENMVLTMTENYGTGSWWSVGDKSDYKSVVVNFASATAAGGNLTVTYNGSETKSQKDFYNGTTTVEVALDETLKSNISQIYVQGGEAGSTYTFASAYLMKAEVEFPTNREGVTNLGYFKAYNDGLDVDGNTITWSDDKSWKGCDTWLGQDLSAYGYMWLLVEVNGSIKMSLQYGDNSTTEKVISTGTPFVGFELNDAQKQATNKIMLQNTTNGGSITIKQVMVGSEAEYEAAKAAYLQEMNWEDFGNAWGTIVAGKTATMNQDWGAAGWWIGNDYSAYTKVLVEFAEPTSIDGNVTVDYEGESQNTSVGFDAGATYVELTMDERKTLVNRIRLSLRTNGSSFTLKSVALVKDFSAPLALDEGSGDNPTALAFRNGAVSDVTLNREFTADGYWYTLCLPFDLDESQIAASFGECQIMQLTESYMKGEDALYLQFDEVATIEAGKPYLFMPSENVGSETVPILFEDVTIDATTPTAYPEGASQLATMTGTYGRPQLTTNQYILVEDNTLAPSDGENWMRAFRAWFELSPSVPAQVKARCVIGRQTPTDLEKTAISTPYTKYVREGKVYILRNGQKYNLMGQTVK
ncbi:MAG: hypothetical protein MJZ79_02685 [Paludibacteraceae bacterium]|nr:hypothetical protein [Paludibacteraceae bacterium]